MALQGDDSFWMQLEKDSASLEFEDLVALVQPVTVGMALSTPIVPAGEHFYRARRFGSGGLSKAHPIRYSDLIYPPKGATRLGRANNEGNPFFYCSVGKEAVFFELGELNPGDEILLTFWQSSRRLILNNIGYTQFVFDAMGAKRPSPTWSDSSNQIASTMSLPRVDDVDLAKLIASDQNRELRDRLSKYFMTNVSDHESHKYKLTAAIAHCHLGAIGNISEQFGGLLYPSVRLCANADNVAMLPWFVDSHMEFKKALHIRIDAWSKDQVSITSLDSAKRCAPDTGLEWLGRLPNWTLRRQGSSAKVILEPGVDKDGDYVRDKFGAICHWAAYDGETGARLEPD